MNATELLDNSHLMVVQVLDNLNELEWDVPGVCGEWTVKEVLAHLTAYEHVLVDVLNVFLGNKPVSYRQQFLKRGETFNQEEVEKRRYDTAQHVLDEYNDMQVEAVSLLAQIPAELLEKKGTMSWYADDCSLYDLIDD